MIRSRFTDIICTMVQLNSKVSPHSVASSSAIDTANHPEIVELLKQSNTESKDEWVSVEDRLPEVKEGNLSSDVVLVSGKYDYTMAVLAKKEGSNVWLKMQKYSDIIVDKITHWQPLPQPPKQGSQS